MTSAFTWQGPWDGFDEPRRHRDRHMRRGDEHGRGRGRRHSHRGPWEYPNPPMPPMPPMPPGPPGFGFGGPPRHGRKAKRGDVRAAILAILAEGPHNGYQLIQEIAERSHGAWRPSPGAVYPALQQLSDEELVQPIGEGRKSRFELTEAGHTYVAEHAEEVEAPWEAMIPQVDEDVTELFGLAQQTASALMQVAQSGTPAQIAKAKQIMTDSRRSLYLLLAED